MNQADVWNRLMEGDLACPECGSGSLSLTLLREHTAELRAGQIVCEIGTDYTYVTRVTCKDCGCQIWNMEWVMEKVAQDYEYPAVRKEIAA